MVRKMEDGRGKMNRSQDLPVLRSVSKADKEGTWQRISEEPAEYLALSDLESVPHLPSSTFHLPGAGERPGG
jgi:hypothetical protein